MNRQATLSVILLFVAGCERGKESTGSPEAVPNFIGVEELMIRSAFGRIQTVLVNEDGMILIPDQQIPAVFIYTPMGELSTTFGRQGQGPGEFETIVGAGWQGDTLWIYDRRRNRTTLVSADFQLLGTSEGPSVVPTLEIDGIAVTGGTPLVVRAESNGRYHVAIYPRADPAIQAQLPETVYATLAPDGSVQTVTARQPRRRGNYFVVVDGRNRGGPYPFAIRPVYEIADDGSRSIFVDVSLENPQAVHLNVTAFDAKGDTIYARSYPVEGVPIPSQVRDSALEAGASRLPPQAAAQYREEAWVSPVYPPLQGAVIAKDGGVWIRLRLSNDSEERYLMLDPQGVPEGVVTFPLRTKVEVVDGENAWAIVTDELDVQSVARFRIAPAEGRD